MSFSLSRFRMSFFFPRVVNGRSILGGLLLSGLAACGGGGAADPSVSAPTGPAAPTTYAIGGTVSGLSGTGLVLQNNAGNDLTITANGSFSFSSKVADGIGYAVTVKTQPGGPVQTCTVNNGVGAVAGANVTSIAVVCSTTSYTVGGTVSGLAGTGLVLQNNAGNDLALNANGSFTFAAPVASGANYAVTVKTQPGSPAQACTVNNGTGTMGGANVTNVTVICATNSYTVGGTVSGLSGTGLVLQNNAGDDLTINANGNFTFATPVASGANYAVTVKTQPLMPAQSCAVTNGSGTMGVSAVSNVAVSCGAQTPRFAYVTANHGGNSVSAYTIDAITGALTQVTGSPFSAGSETWGVAVDPHGKFAFAVNYSSSNVSAYAIDPNTGALTQVVGSPFATGSNPIFVETDPSGKFVYVVNQAGNVYAYTFDSGTGTLSLIAGSPFAAGVFPSAVTVDPSGKYAYVTNENGGNVSAYAINAVTGALTPIAGSPFAAGTGPRSVKIDPSGKFAYVANRGSNNVSAYSINSATGALAQVAGSPFAAGSGAFMVAVDPSGKFVYIANSGGNNVSAYTINAVTGALTSIAGSPFAAGTGPYSVAVDPSGKFVYAGNTTSNNLSVYSINAVTGALTPIAGSPFVTTASPSFITIVGQ